jgi:hypothetical protein
MRSTLSSERSFRGSAIVGRLVVAAAIVLCSLAAHAGGNTASPADIKVSADSVTADLNSAIQWYRDARVTLRSARASAGVPLAADGEQLAREAVERAFAAARAKSALVQAGDVASASTTDSARTEAGRARLEKAVAEQQAEIARLEARARRAPRAERAQIERELTGARDRLEIQRARLDFVAQLETFDASEPGGAPDLPHQIQLLHDSIPELKGAVAVVDATVPPATPTASGTWPLLQRILVLHQTRTDLDDLNDATAARRRAVTADVRALHGALRALGERLHALADTSDAPADMTAEQREFQQVLARSKALAAVVIPRQQEDMLLRRFADDMSGWQRAVDTETRQLVKGVGIDLVRVMIAIAIILVAAIVWRTATLRYVQDVYRRRLILGARKFAVVAAIALVIVVHFASELTTLVTALGFAAAGVAFALQNVILAIAGYFSMMAPHGIRVGDRVSLQGPFGYVHGEVLEIGFVRVRLRELTGDPPAPTGRIVVFPNSVVFTGSFFKNAEGPPAETPRAA